MPPLDSLRVLAVCARRENFSQAAAELGITPAAVSQRMRALEADLGVKLFLRHGPKLTATDRARALGEKLDQALSLMRLAVDDCRSAKPPLRVTCAPTFAGRWLLPRLAAYQALPDADPIALDTAQAIFPDGAFDVAIRNGVGPWPGLEGVKLLGDQLTPMLSPQWAPDPERLTPAALLEIPLIPDGRWPAWFALAGLPKARPSFVATRFPNFELEADAAVRGLGAALLPLALYGELVAQGKLLAPFEWTLEGPAAYWLLWTKEAAGSHFVGWIRSQFA